jgi:O-antigen/teichoic acid export membrane protein
VTASSTTTGELKTLFQQSSHYLIGLIGNLALGFISFPLFTRMFSIADYGMIDFSQKILLLFTAASKAGMQNSALRFYDGQAFSKNPQSARSYYSTMFLGVAMTAAAVTVLVAVSAGLFPQTLIESPLASILSFTSALIFLRALQSILWSFMRIEERTKAYSMVSIGMKVATIAAICFLLPRIGPSVHTYFSATMGVELLAVVALSIPLFSKGLLSARSFDPTLFRTGIAFGLPLVVQEVAGIILDSGDRALVQHYMGADALGFYSVAYGLSAYVNSLLMAPLGLAILPIYMRLWTSEGREKTIEFLSLSLDIFLMTAGAAFVVVAVSSQDAVILLASAKYRGADRLIPTLVAGLLIYTTQVFLNAGLVIHKKTRAMAIALAYSALLNIVLNCLMLPWMGLQAAAVATLVSYAVCTLLVARLAFQFLPLNIQLRPLLGYLFAVAIAWAGVFWIDFGSPIFNLVGKSTLAFALYTAILYIIDRRVRDVSLKLWRQLRQRTTINSAAAA